ncbi:MAG: sigma-70 family RNA polymerase sigma factor [Chloroflexales bacterium]|nr:sigma-70 family RNA polymerase sigma factor [Chloroflexales bacterium]
MTARDSDLASIVARAQAGDHAAFDAVYDRFADPLFRYLYARCGNTTLAEELTSELWVRVVERLPRFRFPRDNPEAAFAGWLYRIAQNLVTDHYRRKANTDVTLAETISNRDAAPDEQVIASDKQRALHAAMEQLTPDQREVIMMRFIEERSHAEVAQLTGRSEGAVKVMQHRALEALARLMRRWRD